LGAFLITLNAAGHSSADTVNKKDGTELKGVVIEDYDDRVKLSTVSGEVLVMKSEIKELYYDDEERAFLKLAEKERDRGNYESAFENYGKALQANPDSKDAREGIAILQEYIYSKDESLRADFIRRHNWADDSVEAAFRVRADTKGREQDALAVKRSLGISLKEKGDVIEIAGVAKGSAASRADLREGDIIVAVWGKLVRYMSLDEVLAILARSGLLRVECMIERTVEVRKTDARTISGTDGIIGASLGMTVDGLTVASVRQDGPASEAGITPGDLVTAIDRNQTRYMPLKRAVQAIRTSKARVVTLDIRRKLMVIKEGGE
jgi:predicted metalloprotease with PDZ domain